MVRFHGASMAEHGPLSSVASPPDDVGLKPHALPIEGLLLLVPTIRTGRGSTCRAACTVLSHAGIAMTEYFMRSSRTERYDRHVVRGLYCQVPPHAQGRLLQCGRGAVWMVGVDVRTGSRSFGQWAGVTLSAENARQLWIPPGFLHGLCCLDGNTEVTCRQTRPDARASTRTIRWNDETLGIEWPVRDQQAVLSPADGHAPSFSNVIDWFPYP
ncbi:dTDP-4-dehydrorhamnose 3,5-epimerase [Komagataeibacter rhaeticus]|nr:dTDP-4-dehydrorhamnose 3,5-epimerase [Komagataeibacter rhaeticus]